MNVYNQIRGSSVTPKGGSTPRRREVGGCWHFDFGEIVFRFNISYLTFANDCPEFCAGAYGVVRAKIDTPYLSRSPLSDTPALTGRVLEILAFWSFHSATLLRGLYQRINASDIRFRFKIWFVLNRSQLLACMIFLPGCLGTVYKTVFSAWLPG